MTDRVVIVGGGVVGAACALYLREAGIDVTIVDRGRFGGGCSHSNCGYVSPSHVLPIAGPGILLDTLRTLFNRDSALKVRLRCDPQSLAWFYRFARRCTRAKMLEAAVGIRDLLVSSRALYDHLFGSTLRDVEWTAGGLLFVFASKAKMNHHAETNTLLSERFGTPATRYDGDELTRFEPTLKPGIAGGWHYACDGHVSPERLLESLRRAVCDRGVEIREQVEVLGAEFTGRRLKRLVTDDGPIPADQVVVATGAWTRSLRSLIGTRLPIEPGKGYSLTRSTPAVCPTHPMIFEEEHVAVTPMASGFRIGSTMEFAGFDESLRDDRLDLLRRGADRYLREPVGENFR
ncbi:MAG: FAD-dependent oxidoreductase, partial [Planctomycetota bacterium]